MDEHHLGDLKSAAKGGLKNQESVPVGTSRCAPDRPQGRREETGTMGCFSCSQRSLKEGET